MNLDYDRIQKAAKQKGVPVEEIIDHIQKAHEYICQFTKTYTVAELRVSLTQSLEEKK